MYLLYGPKEDHLMESKKQVLYRQNIHDGQTHGRVAQISVSDGKAECENTRANAIGQGLK